MRSLAAPFGSHVTTWFAAAIHQRLIWEKTFHDNPDADDAGKRKRRSPLAEATIAPSLAGEPDMLKVWGRRSSFNVQKVLWLVGELGLAHEHIPAGGSFGRLDEPGFRSLNPHGRVPVIEDGDVTAWESQTILRYLAAKYGRDALWDDDPAMRARVECWMDWSQTTLQPDFLGGVFWRYYRTPETQRDRSAIRRSLARCADHFRLLDDILKEQRFLAGDRLSLADIPAGTSLYRYFELDIDRPDLPNVTAWYQHLQQRPAYREHVMIPFAELSGRLDY
jgi:glutathione S-transferase